METENLISTDEFCALYNVEYSFVSSLQQSGLIEIQTLEERRFIPTSQLVELEKYVRLHDELDINLEGIEAINHLLQRIRTMQDEIESLKTRLRLYEII
jgi:chaperone modulatory protein CbpM